MSIPRFAKSLLVIIVGLTMSACGGSSGSSAAAAQQGQTNDTSPIAGIATPTSVSVVTERP